MLNPPDQEATSAVAGTAGVCDPVTLEIAHGAISAAQREMEALIERTATSAFICEKKDFYTALFDGHEVMAAGSMVPIFGAVFRRANLALTQF